ncbi:penicillin-binding protein activator [Xanthomonas translucens]|uniref:penicillin-binding protein activator n=3 Tax=Xanthomonas campestris pv. translucens TaxID=343 RepID=UPI000641B584|nr:penicillin-binding protein activator [Xanthomonas translucens]MCS3359150.1 penicillin-binding protein activator [Xanthomonas translucens pv. translucens]MCS3372181.1 penicillin-binding protein activator [Xanthomonas translucens pv. translucens]MCT8270979.1 penicillin-binding protein activator [Xanthomonas translucens pv. undulosa]MCT8272850.1 penicillin-binding protein activator [Xanthomonas translucens pv. translucens]MCT8276923.1 penicillin-binding protein activator [Xanthomonas transluce
MNKRFARISALALLALLFAGCATTSVTQSASSPAQSAALLLLERGQPREAALQLEAQAAAAAGSERNQLLADAAFAWYESGDAARARSLAAQVQPRQLSGLSKVRLALVNAELALVDRQPAQALQALGSDPQAVPQNLRARWHLARAQALEGTGDATAALDERARADIGLTGQARSDNQRAIVRQLAALDDATLKARAAALPAGDPLYNFAGRALISRGLALPRPFDRGEQWGFDTSKRPPAERDGYRPPAKLAVLLPLSGTLANVAAPVRDGLLAGYYGETRRRPEIDFIDTTGTAAGALAAYQKAIDGGADFVVGPLGRDEVSALFARDALPVPLLALNRGTSTPPAGNAGFSLAPEDDGIAAAEYLLAHERRNALVVGSNDDNGRRAVAAFRERFSERGGKVAASVSVAEVPGDVGAQLRNASAADAVFLAVKGSTARALAPQLALAGFAGKSRVATSQLVLGTGKPEDDLVLDGIAYPSELWNVRGVGGLPAASSVAETLPTARGQAARLFAFGYDAWQISAYLEKLATGAEANLRGATGVLHLDGFGNILRTPAWSTFSGGRATPLPDGR